MGGFDQRLCDDYKKLTKRSSSGLSGRVKLAAEIVVAGIASILVMQLTRDPLATTLAVPFFKNLLIPFGGFFLAFNVVVMVGASNAVNLTDGLDGLAIVPAMLAAGAPSASSPSMSSSSPSSAVSSCWKPSR